MLALPNSDRPKPIRYDFNTWLVMRIDPVLPAAIITRQKTADGLEYFRAVSWDLEPKNRLLIGRSATLGGADNLVRYPTPRPPVASPKDGDQWTRLEVCSRPMKLALAVALIVLLTGCASAEAKPSPKFTAKPSASAATIASHIKACKDVEAGDIGKGGPSLLSTATCHILGHTVVINSWEFADGADPSGLLAQNGDEIYYVDGGHWTAFIGDDPTLQLQFTNEAGELFRRQLDGKTAAPVDVSGSQDVARAVVKSVSGKVVHFQP